MANLRQVPSVASLISALDQTAHSQQVRAAAARRAAAMARERAASGEEVDRELVVRCAVAIADEISAPTMKHVVNFTGVLLHTGLGRARLAKRVAEHLGKVSAGHAAIEMDLDSGRRGSRQSHLRWLLHELTGAEDAVVVNNCAAAVVLALSALGGGREVVLSRGQMIEIGGSFRLPDIVKQSGCRLVEVGCTNKTHLRDYEAVIGPDTAAVVLCHRSNYEIIGFTEDPTTAEVAALCKKKGVLLLEDLGSGCLQDTARYGLPHERTVQEAVRDGADIVTSSCDKMLGGPQGGMILGRTELIEKVKKHPFARVVRIDKLTVAALEATLRLHWEGSFEEIPLWNYMARPADEVRAMAEQIASAYHGEASVEEGKTEVGGGSLPGGELRTFRVGLRHPKPVELARVLRKGTPPIAGRIEENAVWLDPRTLDQEELPAVLEAVRKLDDRAG